MANQDGHKAAALLLVSDVSLYMTVASLLRREGSHVDRKHFGLDGFKPR